MWHNEWQVENFNTLDCQPLSAGFSLLCRAAIMSLSRARVCVCVCICALCVNGLSCTCALTSFAVDVYNFTPKLIILTGLKVAARSNRISLCNAYESGHNILVLGTSTPPTASNDNSSNRAKLVCNFQLNSIYRGGQGYKVQNRNVANCWNKIIGKDHQLTCPQRQGHLT